MPFTIDPIHDALVVTDIQVDFCPGGALPVPEGDAIIPVINQLLALDWRAVATRDWHPAGHSSFVSVGGIWPPHCVAGTAGADFHPALVRDRFRHVVSKATELDTEAYSAFQGTDLAEWLRREGVRRLFISGVATDYCVRATTLDARRAGFEVVVLTDAVRGIEAQPGDCAGALTEMQAAGAHLATSGDLVPAAAARADRVTG